MRNDTPEAPINRSTTGNPTVKAPGDYVGNHAVGKSAPARYAVFARLQTSSVRVDVLGLLGNSLQVGPAPSAQTNTLPATNTGADFG